MEQVWIILMSRLARALWIEIGKIPGIMGRCESRLARALWIEIYGKVKKWHDKNSRGSREPCGLKLINCQGVTPDSRRGSREPCGLKFGTLTVTSSAGSVEARESLVD